MHILLIGPYWNNAKHGAEVGVYNALIELGHKVSIWDYRANRYRIEQEDIPDEISSIIIEDVKNVDCVLCLGPGLPDHVIESEIFQESGDLRVLWNSEPIRLPDYLSKMRDNKKHFSVICTFDESELPLYRDQLGINAVFLPQAFNPEWYNPLKIPRSQKFPNAFCFIGSIGGKWAHRHVLISRLSQAGFTVHVTTLFDAQKVNQAYNIHSGVLNLGLYCDECGPQVDLKSFGLQQRIFETIGAGQICITNEIPAGTNELFEHGEHVLTYNSDNLEEICRLALDKKTATHIKEKILKIRDKHTYKERMKQLLRVIDW